VSDLSTSARGATVVGSDVIALDRIRSLAPSETPRAAERLRRRMGRTSRRPLAILTVVFAVNVSQNALLPAVFPLIKVEFRLSDTALGFLGSTFLVMGSIGLVPFALLADRYTRTKIIAWACLGWGVLILLMGTAGSYARLLVTRTLLGLTDPAEQPSSYSLLTDYYPVHERGRVFAIWGVGQLAGIMLVPVAGVVAEVWGWRAAFHLFAIPGFVLALLVWRMHEPPRGAQDRASLDLIGEQTAPESARAERPWSARAAVAGYGQLLRIPTVLVALLSLGLTAFLTRGLGVWLTVFFVRYHEMNLGEATGAVALMALGALLGSLGAGFLSDELESRGIRAARMRVAAVTSVLAGGLLFAAFAVDSTPLMLGLFFAGAVCVFPSSPLLQACIADVVDPDLRGRGASLDTFAQTAFGASAVLIFGILSDGIGLRAAVLSLVPMVTVGGLVVWLVGTRVMPRDAELMRSRLRTGDGAG
jgi:MFS family permease